MSTMLDRGVSTLNPNAPVFDPVGFREVEDFSPKWWELVTTSKWFRDFWLSVNTEYEFGGDGESSDMEEEFEELIMSSDEAEIARSTVDTVTGNENYTSDEIKTLFSAKTMSESDVARFLKVLLSMAESTKGKLYRSNVTISSCSPKYNQKKTSKYMDPNFSCRRNHQIYQPR